MSPRLFVAVVCLGLLLFPAPASTQISFPKSVYYLAMGDSVAAGQGALPMTHGYTYQLYDRGVFGRKSETLYVNAAVKGTRSWDLRDHQVPQVLCATSGVRPTVVSITAGAIDFLSGDLDIPAIALRVAEAVDLLLNNGTGLVNTTVTDPFSGAPCPVLSDVTILVSNYYRIPHPVPQFAALLDQVLQGFDQALRVALQAVPVPPGSRVAVVDLYSASAGRTGLVLVERRLGFVGPLDIDVHPTNLGHTFIAQEFEAVWNALQ
jgi:lysophospholipase L1-like esterase